MKQHIILFGPSLHTGGGTERVLVNLANELSKNGYPITILTNQLGSNKIFPLSDKVLVYEYGFGSKQTKQPNNLFLKVIYKLAGARILEQTLTKLSKPNTLIISFSAAITYNCFKTKFKNQLISFEHYPFWAYDKFPAAQQQIILNYPKLRKVVVLTEHELEVYKKLGCNVMKISNTYPFCPESPSLLKTKKVLSVGHFNDAKRRDLLIASWQYVHAQHPDWELIIVGDGPYKGDCIQQIADLNLQNSIKIIDPTDKVMDYYLDASLFVLSSEFETMPLVLLEAKISGLPCVSFDIVSGPSEIINEGIDGFLVPFADIHKMAEKMNYLIANPDKRIEFGKAGRSDAIKRFNPEKTYQAWFDFLSKN